MGDAEQAVDAGDVSALEGVFSSRLFRRAVVDSDCGWRWCNTDVVDGANVYEYVE